MITATVLVISVGGAFALAKGALRVFIAFMGGNNEA